MVKPRRAPGRLDWKRFFPQRTRLAEKDPEILTKAATQTRKDERARDSVKALWFARINRTLTKPHGNQRKRGFSSLRAEGKL